MSIKLKEQKKDDKREKYYFFLNPYEEYAFTKCPKCERKTKLKKFALVIHVKPRSFFILNKTCRYCPSCELIIVKQSEIESLMVNSLKKESPGIVGNKYLVGGTIDKADWKQIIKGEFPPNEIKNRMYFFSKIF